MTMDGITTSFSFFFVTTWVFFFLLHYVDGDGDGNGNGGEVKQLLTWVTKLVCLSTWGWKRTQSAGEIFFFPLLFF